ncbi:hypothetical protein [Tenacibaculum sp. M341]|uniref:hypothetical protein n=1 Tax=Tenacibaculum sp. M341 TaxID=2530339 RepID=UPI00104C9B29|nr:hypothetical protein [Tenacibaculum sp. M341]TCI92214.1 hypothetical protein EYW44_08515 [Tenacibaculum sp. M341]
MRQSKQKLKTFFERGDIPTEEQFSDLIDSYLDSKQPSGEANRRFVIDADGDVHITTAAGVTTLQEDICWEIAPPKHTVSFKKLDSSDASLIENRDVIIPGELELTGLSGRGLFNHIEEDIVDEKGSSPVGTLWAMGTLSDDITSLSFYPFVEAYRRNNPDVRDFSGVVGQTYVVKIVESNEYFEITFTNWSSRFSGELIAAFTEDTKNTREELGFGYTRTSVFTQDEINSYGEFEGVVSKSFNESDEEVLESRVFFYNSQIIDEPNNWKLNTKEEQSRCFYYNEPVLKMCNVFTVTNKKVLNQTISA